MTTDLLTRPAAGPDIVDDATRREFLAMLGAAGLLVACGDGGGGTAGVDGGSSITVRHAGGATVFSTVPRRVVILDDAMLGDVLGFDVVPVGTAAGATDPTVIEVWRGEAGVDHIELVAPDFTPNLEAVAAVRPDAIFAMAFQVEEAFWDDLQRIAPTIAVETDVNPDALDTRFDELAMRTYAEVFRRPDVVDDLVAEYQSRVQAIRADFADVIEGRTISFAGSFDGTTVRADVATGWAGAVLADLGFRFPEAQTDNLDPDFPVRVEFSPEETERFLGSSDIVLWRDFNRDDLAVEDGFPAEAVDANPLLAQLPAARAGRVFTVSNRVWFLRSLRGRFVLLDQLEGDLLPRVRA